MMAVAWSVPLVSTCGVMDGPLARGSILRELDGAGVPRTLGVRLSIRTEFRTCGADLPRNGTIPVTRCAPLAGDTLLPERIVRLSALASRAAPMTSDPDTLHAFALMDLLWPDSAGNSLTRSISYLESAARLSDHPAPALTDLAAAYVARAERTQDARDLLEAVEAAERALELEENPAALFNLGLALDRLGLDDEAKRAWQRFHMAERSTG